MPTHNTDPSVTKLRMTSAPNPSRNVIAANIAVHTAMAATYEEREPHFRPENKASVRSVLESISRRTGRGRLLDLGCGTGFVIDLARDLFDRIDGVDVTQAMLDRVDTSGGHVVLHRQPCESLSFDDATFDAATAYSFLDHLEDYSLVLREAFRVLRPGGVLYADLLPNRRFWESIASAAGRGGVSSPLVKREIEMLTSQPEMVERDYAVDADTFIAAEPWKTATRGIAAEEFTAITKDIGFASIDIRFQWYLGQGAILHGVGARGAELVETHLRDLLPVSESLFKYLRVELTR
jgi:ubiquinone/menaquinone biosynthesis C-methylase UbiE